ncbi:uncharacterized protein LOC143918639 [Arctopsyche grandis]|uniref:uncharacterized protein LOC143918639 n=1 Tax=Arctopsyche grandis TaxID=121162 RepID=UPI00406D95EA
MTDYPPYKRWFTISNWHPLTAYYFRSSKSIRKEQQAHFTNHENVYVHPLSRFRWCWESFMMFLYLTYFLCLTFQISFQKPEDDYSFEIVIFIMDAIFLVDIYLNFNTGCANKFSRTVLMDRNKIRRGQLGTHSTDTTLRADDICGERFYTRFLYTSLCKINSDPRCNENEIFNDEYMTNLGFPSAYKNVINRYNYYMYRHKYYNENVLMEILPDHFRAEIHYYSCSSVCKNEIFIGVPMVVVANIVSRLKYEIYMPEDCITTPGFLGEALYFILHGSVRIYTPSGKEFCHKTDGEIFGIIPMILKNTLTMSLSVSIEVTEIYKLERDDFNELVLPDETLSQNIKKMADKLKKYIEVVDYQYRVSKGLE